MSNEQTEVRTELIDRPATSLSPIKAAVLAAYAECGRVDLACKSAKVDRTQHYRWLKSDADYAAAFEESDAVAAQGLKDEARRRAVEGLRKYRFNKNGKPILHPETGLPYYDHIYSDALLLAKLRAKFPDEYRDRSSVEIEGRLEKMSDDELRERARKLGVTEVKSIDLEG